MPTSVFQIAFWGRLGIYMYPRWKCPKCMKHIWTIFAKKRRVSVVYNTTKGWATVRRWDDSWFLGRFHHVANLMHKLLYYIYFSYNGTRDWLKIDCRDQSCMKFEVIAKYKENKNLSRISELHLCPRFTRNGTVSASFFSANSFAAFSSWYQPSLWETNTEPCD